MGALITFVMYVLWVLTIIFILAATFTSFQFEDLNLLAVVFFILAVVNSFFASYQKKS